MEEQAHLIDAGGGRRLQLLSVVAPVYNEVALIEVFYQRVCTALEGLAFELVLVDDGSSDGSLEMLERLAESDPRVRLVVLSRNFGHQTALTAGLDHAQGDAVVMMDADLQDPPELILEMLEHWRSGIDVVYAVRDNGTASRASSWPRPRGSTGSSTGWPRLSSSRTRATSGCLTAACSMRCSRCASATASCAG